MGNPADSSGSVVDPKAPADGDSVQFNVQVSNIPTLVSKDDLEHLLKREQVEGDWHVKIHTGRHAFICFNTKELASGAIKKLKNKYLQGMELNISKKPIRKKYPEKAVRKVGPSHDDCREMDDLEKNTIDNQEDYITFIKKLRVRLANRIEGPDDIFGYSRRVEGSETAHPLLTGKPSGGNPLDMFIYIKIAVEEGSDEVPILAIQKDNVYIKGFMNKNKQWFELPERDSMVQHLKEGLGAKRLEEWDETYGGTMKLERRYQVDNTLMCARLGRAFAMRALRRLWNYDPSPKKVGNNDDDNPIRHGLAGLFVMISEAARMDPFLHTIAGGWNGETGLTKELAKIRREWGSMSAALLKCREGSYMDWPSNWKYSLGYALASIRLVCVAKYVTGPATWVEIFSASADPPANSITIEGEGDIFPQKNAQGPKVMDQEHGIYISAHEWFCISVDYDDGSPTRQFKLPCSKQDTEPVTASFNCGGKKLDVIYLVMSDDAVKATVNVNLVPEGDSKDAKKVPEKKGDGVSGKQEMKYTVRKGGQISASIGQRKIMLLSSEEECEIIGGRLTLSLPRRHVMVPCGKQLHIYMENLVVTDDSAKMVANIKDCIELSFDFSSPTAKPDDSSKVVGVGVDISWDKDHIGGDTDISWDTETDKNKVHKWTIRNSGSFTELIEGLRDDMCAKASPKKVFGTPVLYRHAKLPDRWTTHIKVQVEGEKSSIALAIREDILFPAGFMNQAEVWYSLTSLMWDDELLGRTYNSVRLDWGGTYQDLLQGTDVKELMKKLGKEFAVDAVRTLSRYPDVEDEDEPRLALLGLMFMVCDSSIWKPLQTYFEQVWDGKDCDAHKHIHLLTCCIGYWDAVSHALLRGDADGKEKQTYLDELSKKFGSEEDAKRAIDGIQLVFGCN